MTHLRQAPRQGAGRRTHALFGGAIALLFGAALTGGAPALAQQPKATAELGQASSSGPMTVDLSAVRSLTDVEAASFETPPHPRGSLSPAEYEAAKAAAAHAAATPSGQAGPAPVGAVGEQTPGASIVFAGQSQVGSIRPSDMALAASPSWVVQVVNSSIAVYNKSGVLQTGFPKSLAAFIPGSTGDDGDPRAFYDWNAGRFVVEVDDFTNGLTYIAASATNDPRGSWRIYSFNPWGPADCRSSGSTCNDFPMLGFDDSTIYLSLNVFPSSGGWSAYMLLLPKAQIYAGAGFGYNFWSNLSFNGIRQDSVQPVNLLTGDEHPRAGFAINSHNNFATGQCTSSACNGLVVWAFSNNLQASGSPGPELSAVLVGTANNYTLPAGANGPGCAHCVDTNDPRISATPSFHDGKMTGALETAGSDAEYHVLWFQVLPTLNDNDSRCTGSFLNKCPQITGASILNEDCFFCGGQGASGGSYFGTLTSDIGGDLTMEYTYSDNNTNPESVYVSRRVTQARNTMHDAGFVMCGGGSTAYLQGRWGDYSAAAGDITSATQDFQWFSGMNDSGGRWATCIGKNGFTSVTQP